MEIGLLLQHFGANANRESVILVAPALEEGGFDAVWVRDHLMFQPHAFESGDSTFMEPFTTLAAIGAITQRLKLGTAVTIPFRHPLVTSQLYGGIASASSPDRVIAGIGAGTPRQPFDATEQDYEQRIAAVKELGEILRLTWSGEPASYTGELYRFHDVLLNPRPDPNTPIWYGGSSPAAIRRAVEYCDGWLAGKCPLTMFDRLRARLREADPAGERVKKVAISPIISVAENRRRALDFVDVEGLLKEARSHRTWRGPFNTVDDLEGIVIAGSPAECVKQLGAFSSRGIDHVILDLRFRSDEFMSQAIVISQEILPMLREKSSTSEWGQGLEG